MRDKPLARIASLIDDAEVSVTHLADGSAVLLDLGHSQVLSLNATGAYVLRQLQGGVSDVDRLVGLLQAEYDVEAEIAQRDLEVFCEELAGFLGGHAAKS